MQFPQVFEASVGEGLNFSFSEHRLYHS